MIHLQYNHLSYYLLTSFSLEEEIYFNENLVKIIHLQYNHLSYYLFASFSLEEEIYLDHAMLSMIQLSHNADSQNLVQQVAQNKCYIWPKF